MSKINNSSDTHIDINRYSRQSYAVGKDVMTKLSEAKVLVIGYNTLERTNVNGPATQQMPYPTDGTGAPNTNVKHN